MLLYYQMRQNIINVVGDKNVTYGMIKGRVRVLSGFFFLAFVALMVRAFDLSVIQAQPQGAVERDFSVVRSDDVQSLAGRSGRGAIYDASGVLVATSLGFPSLYADPKYISDPEAAARSLVKLFPHLDYLDLVEDLSSRKRFVWIARQITPEQQEQVMYIGEPGLQFKNEPKRVYPQGVLFSHMIGYADVDHLGQAGIERRFEDRLSQGQAVYLTLDTRIQHIARKALLRSVDRFEAKGGVAMVMDVNTGALVAGVSYPDFDPHHPGDVPVENLFNRMTLGAYELGSIFKIFSTAALLEFEHSPMGLLFDVRKPIESGGFKINDYHSEGRILSLPEVFMYSSNIGTAMMGDKVGTKRLRAFYRDLGLLDRMEFDVSEVAAPIVPEPWREINTLTASYGHGIASTPVQVMGAVASLVNGGYQVKPHIIAQVSDKAQNEAARVRLVSEETSQKVRQLLRLTVTDGTAGKADVPGYVVGGKTGTAEKIKENGRGYDRDRLISSFVGVFPSHEPKYAVMVMVDEPKGQKESHGYATAGWVAAPAVAEIVTGTGAVMGMAPIHDQPVRDFGQRLKRFVSARGKH